MFGTGAKVHLKKKKIIFILALTCKLKVKRKIEKVSYKSRN